MNPNVSDHPIPKESKRAVEVNFSQGKSILRITMRNDEISSGTKMIKLRVEPNKGE